ncbi:CLUMA_CG018680, isoform A [Clunio marinus]|uniref:CLUMA_CG018680, isoform A n=1 Tax=Clunio marinus TaxID=568069 RepID=A0A1J1J1L1_9DIPT|nr:CLUMA_CG018680, isoform A [Clunio marinus]
MSLSTVTITLILVKLNAASFVLPEGQRCDTFCISNSTFNPSEITGVYYLIHILPRDFLEKTSCNSLTIQPPQGNRQDYVFSDTINGARRHIPGYFVSRGSQVDIYHSER